MPYVTAARIATYSMISGAIYGLGQDTIDFYAGRRVRWIDWSWRRLGWGNPPIGYRVAAEKEYAALLERQDREAHQEKLQQEEDEKVWRRENGLE